MMLRGMLLAGGLVLASITASAEETAIDGAELFRRTCAMCHGPDGKATTPVAKRMGVKDLSTSQLTDEQIRGAIETGIRGAKGVMPAYGGRFSEAELAAIVQYVRSFRAAENDAK